jgi:predicted DNA-binding WGR domain protein
LVALFHIAGSGKSTRLQKNIAAAYASPWVHRVLFKTTTNKRKSMNVVTATPDRVSLYYREGSSDKVYQAAIEPVGQQFVVNFAYGRRGATLTTGTKTSTPVDYATAKKIYTKLVGEKKAKGYTEGADGTPYQHTDKQASGILPQLLNPIEESEVELLLRDDNYCAQEKFDGRHLLVRKQDDHLEGINKKGLLVGLPQTVVDDFRQFPGSLIPDGESIGDDYHQPDESASQQAAPACPLCRDRVHDPPEDRTMATAAAGES